MDITTATPAEVDTRIQQLADEAAELRLQIKRMQARMGQIADESVALSGEYSRRGGWSRVYRVNNTNGHVHDTMTCRNTYDSTEFAWFPQYSGLTAEEIVELAGEFTCLSCFGEVRADILKAREGRPCRIESDDQRKSREEREAAAAAKTAAKQAKAVAKAAKALVNPVRINGSSFVITTKSEAWSRLTEALTDEIDWAGTEYAPHVQGDRRASNLRDARQDAATLRAALVESLPELTADQFEAELGKKLKAKKASLNRQLKATGFAARY